MPYGGGYNPGGSGGRTRMSTRVFLNVYDLSPANEYLYHAGLGLHHSGVEIMNIEYSFGSGNGIFETTPRIVPEEMGNMIRFREQYDMGTFDGGNELLQKVLDELRDTFGPNDYNLIRKNCNNFANALCWKLLHKKIPSHINRLADIAICCGCLLPQSALGNAPVNGGGNSNKSNVGGGHNSGFTVRAPPNRSIAMSRGSSSSTNSNSNANARKTASSSSSSSSSSAAAWGTGARLGGGGGETSSASSSSSSSFAASFAWGVGGSSTNNNTTNNNSNNADDLTDRRERARKAALARLEKSKQEQ